MSVVSQAMRDGNTVEVEEATATGAGLAIQKGSVHALIISNGSQGYCIRIKTINCPADVQDVYDDFANTGNRLEHLFVHPDDYKIYEGCFISMSQYGIIGVSSSISVWPHCFSALPDCHPVRNNGKTTTLVLKAIEHAQQGRSVRFYGGTHSSTLSAIKYFENICQQKMIMLGRVALNGGYAINGVVVYFQDITVATSNALHADIVIVDDEHYVPANLIQAAQSVATQEFVTLPLMHARAKASAGLIPPSPAAWPGTITIKSPVFKADYSIPVAKKCECGSDAVKSPRHSDWCPKHS